MDIVVDCQSLLLIWLKAKAAEEIGLPVAIHILWLIGVDSSLGVVGISLRHLIKEEP